MLSENELLIIGNGFDLQVGLNSSVHDFYKYRYLPLKKEDFSLEEWKTQYIQQEDDISVWDLIILSQQPEIEQTANWKDIELIIAETVKGNSLKKGKSTFKKDLFSDLNYVRYNYDSILQSKEELESFSKPNLAIRGTLFLEFQLAFLIINLIMETDFKELKEIFQKKNKPDYAKFNDKETAIILKYLMSELHKFESAFSKYLWVQVGTKEDTYIEKSRELTEILMKNEKGPIKLLSFNYTNPFYSWGNDINLRNIHGSLKDDNVIFGVDSNIITEQPDSMELFKFTKTSRILKLASNTETDSWSFGGSPLQQITIYGHSLGEADYSYFQSIFDSINLYQGKTKLVFAYSIYDYNKSEEIKTHYENAVENLMSQYGKSFTNQSHGRNLLHKLLLEDRIQIKLISGFNK
ncbi:AbiH family protein [Leuconostoc pseudomesenteroides]|uniref:AbiH family protein n=1 Tax=Leuconostoc pseudomesenteroides TaxID=33968 RepID=UPI0040371F3E